MNSFFDELYETKKSILMLENINNGYSEILTMFNAFLFDSICSLDTTSIKGLINQLRKWHSIIKDKIPQNIRAEFKSSDYTVYTEKFYNRKFWNEIENDDSVQCFLDWFKLYATPQNECQENIQANGYAFDCSDFNNHTFYFESEEQLKKFIDKYGIDCGTAFIIDEMNYTELWNIC